MIGIETLAIALRIGIRERHADFLRGRVDFALAGFRDRRPLARRRLEPHVAVRGDALVVHDDAEAALVAFGVVVLPVHHVDAGPLEVFLRVEFEIVGRESGGRRQSQYPGPGISVDALQSPSLTRAKGTSTCRAKTLRLLFGAPRLDEVVHEAQLLQHLAATARTDTRPSGPCCDSGCSARASPRSSSTSAIRNRETPARRWRSVRRYAPAPGTRSESAVALGGLERVDHVQVVRPGFGPVFPGMHGGVGADVRLRPVRGRALLVVALHRLVVVVASRRRTARGTRSSELLFLISRSQ